MKQVFRQKINPMKRVILLICLSWLSLMSIAQHWCGSASTTGFVAVVEANQRPKSEVTIPVVVHVVWQTEAERISEEQVQSQIDALNEDFRATNADQEDIISFYQVFVADTEINFELVDMDLEGNPHSGIIYKKTNISGIATEFEGGQRRVSYDELGGSDAWPTDCYLNIWVAGISLTGVAGIGVFPDQVGNEYPAEEDGVFIRPDRFGTVGSVSEPYHLGRTATHEIGHYLNVLHPWGAATPPENCSVAVCCDDPVYDDFVEDTGKQIRTYLGQCPGGGSIDCPGMMLANSQNFMGFANDACALMFTEGQKTRMWETLMTSRSTLLKKCTTSTVDVVVQEDDWLANVYWQQDQLRLKVEKDDVHWRLYAGNGQLVNDIGVLQQGDFLLDLPMTTAGLYILSGTWAGKQCYWKVMKL